MRVARQKQDKSLHKWAGDYSSCETRPFLLVDLWKQAVSCALTHRKCGNYQFHTHLCSFCLGQERVCTPDDVDLLQGGTPSSGTEIGLHTAHIWPFLSAPPYSTQGPLLFFTQVVSLHCIALCLLPALICSLSLYFPNDLAPQLPWGKLMGLCPSHPRWLSRASLTLSCVMLISPSLQETSALQFLV